MAIVFPFDAADVPSWIRSGSPKSSYLSSERDIRRAAEPDRMSAGIEAAQQPIVMSNNLLKRQLAHVGRAVSVLQQRDVVPERYRSARGRVDAVLRHATTDHQMVDRRGLEPRRQVGLEEGIAARLLHDRFAGH